jgi:phospholipase/carboxylesterase
MESALFGPSVAAFPCPPSRSASAGPPPVFIGCSNVDFHIPLERVHESADVFRRMGGDVTERIYPGMGHSINDDEVKHVRGILAGLVQSRAA